MSQLTTTITVAERQGNMILLDSSLEWERNHESNDIYFAQTNRFYVSFDMDRWKIWSGSHLMEEGKFTGGNMSADQRKRIAQLRFTSFLNSLI